MAEEVAAFLEEKYPEAAAAVRAKFGAGGGAANGGAKKRKADDDEPPSGDGGAVAAAAASSSSGAGGELSMATKLVQGYAPMEDPYGSANMPIYQTATFKQTSATEFGDFDYTRSGNPTRTAAETALAVAEGAKFAYTFSTGMAALAAVTRLVGASRRRRRLRWCSDGSLSTCATGAIPTRPHDTSASIRCDLSRERRWGAAP